MMSFVEWVHCMLLEGDKDNKCSQPFPNVVESDHGVFAVSAAGDNLLLRFECRIAHGGGEQNNHRKYHR